MTRKWKWFFVNVSECNSLNMRCLDSETHVKMGGICSRNTYLLAYLFHEADYFLRS